MRSIPDHSEELRRLKRLVWWETIVKPASILASLALLGSYLRDTPIVSSEIADMILHAVFPIAIIFCLIVNGTQKEDTLGKDFQALKRYEKFRRFYDIFRSEPTLVNGERFSYYYLSTQSNHTEAHKVMAEALQLCIPTLIELGVIVS